MQASPVKAHAEAPATSATLVPAETEEVTSATAEAEESIMGVAAGLVEGGLNTPEVVVARAPTPEGYFGREKVTPFMERHLRKLQVRTLRFNEPFTCTGTWSVVGVLVSKKSVEGSPGLTFGNPAYLSPDTRHVQ